MTPPRILIVDDKEDNLYLLRTLLQADGFEVAEAHHGAEALDLARRSPPDLVVADILMPVMDGFSLCREWKQDPRLHSIPFVFYTATYTDGKDRDFALSLGAEDFIVKPAEPDALLAALRAALQKPPPSPPPPAAPEEAVFLKQYSETLIRKLEEKTLQLERDIAERKRTEQALRESQEALSLFMRHSPIYSFIKEVSPSQSRVLVASENYDRMIGIPGSQMAGKTMDELFPPDFAAKISADDWAVVSRGETLKLEEELNGRQYVTLKFPIPQEGRALLAGYTIDVTEQKQAVEALRESEERFRLLVKNSSDVICIIEPDYTQRFVSPSVERITGFSAEELQQKTIVDVVHPDDLPLARAAFEQAIAHPGQVFSARYRHIHKTLGWVHLEAIGQSALDVPSVHGVILSVRDISERMRAETALRESEERFRLLVKNSSDIIGILDLDGSQRYVSPAAETITGFSAETLQRMSVAEVVHPDDLPRVQAGLHECLEHPEKPHCVRYRHIHKTRGWVHVEAIGQSALDDPAVHGIVISVRDISERVRAEEERMESQARFAELFNANPSGLILVDRASRVIAQINPAAAAMIGLPPDQIVGQICNGFICPAETSACPICDLGQSLDRAERVLVRADGSHLPILKTVVPVLLGGQPYLLESFIDLSVQKASERERDRLQSQLNQAQKMESVGRLAGGVAHDFNNMLGVILGHVELALQDAAPDHPLRKDLLEIQKAASRSADLTRQLLAFARKQTVVPQVLDLNATVEGMLQMLRRLIGENIALSWSPGNPLGPVKMDPSQIHQILANLCVNARDAIAGAGEVAIASDDLSVDPALCAQHPGLVPGDYVRLTVRDTGSGMDANTLAHLFEPFFTTKEVGKGTGLGLATVYGIVKQNAGYVDVRSEPGRGTTFQIYLPRHKGPSSRDPAPAPAAPVAKGHETILLVEDEPSILGVGKTMLEKMGYRVLAAPTPGEALRLAEAHSGDIHLLITDVIMPEMNGRELAKNLLSLYPHLRRLFMSGYTADVIAAHGVLDDGTHFIQKPFTMKTLSEKVREALDPPT